MTTKNYGAETEKMISGVVAACERYGSRSIVALAGVPGTGKSYIASIAAQRFAGEPDGQGDSVPSVLLLRVHRTAHRRLLRGNAFGVFLDWNQRAWDDPEPLRAAH